MSILSEQLLHVVKLLLLKGINLGALPSMKQSLTLLLQQDGEISIALELQLLEKALMAGPNSQRRRLQNLVQLESRQHHGSNQQTYDQHSPRLVHTQ
jgi:hypothetical protein